MESIGSSDKEGVGGSKSSEFDLEDWKERNRDLSHKSREQILQECCKSVPSFPSNLGAIGGLDAVVKFCFVHDVDPKLWEKYVAECRESEVSRSIPVLLLCPFFFKFPFLHFLIRVYLFYYFVFTF